MRKFYTVLSVMAGILLSGCIEISDLPYEEKMIVEQYVPHCSSAAVIEIDDMDGTMEFPACMDNYVPEPNPNPQHRIIEVPQTVIVSPENPEEKTVVMKKVKKKVKKIRKITPQFEQDVDPDSIEGNFPDVMQNKYVNEIVLENQNNHILAYCRGDDEAAERCASRLENLCYVRVSDIPRLAAKYDILKTGTYPTRRWREGEVVPRW